MAASTKAYRITLGAAVGVGVCLYLGAVALVGYWLLFDGSF